MGRTHGPQNAKRQTLEGIQKEFGERKERIWTTREGKREGMDEKPSMTFREGAHSISRQAEK